jgi:hypothetical protein
MALARSVRRSVTSRVLPEDVPQQYFAYSPPALVLLQETKPQKKGIEGNRRVRADPERSEWHRKPSHYEYHAEPITASEAGFRHAGWAVVRERVRTALNRTRSPALRIDRFENCGSGCLLQRKVGEARVRLSANYCHDRFCLPCATARSRSIAANLGKLCGDAPVAHLVLTIRHNEAPLGRQFDRLVSAFADVRRGKLWNRSVVGGAYFFEVKRSKDEKSWHPHLHVILSGSYIDQKALSDAWLKATGDSNYVYIKAITDTKKVVKYAAKYASKPFDPSILRHDDWIDCCIVALRGRRMCSTFGQWRGSELEDDDTDDGVWVTVGRLDAIIRDADRGSRASQGLMAMISPRWAERYGFAPTPPDDPASAARS